MIRVAVIGFGHWGPNLARNLALAAGAELVAVCDIDPARLALALQQHPGVCTTTVALDVIQRADIDAVVIATPVHRHFDISLAALRAGKHVLVTKPMTETSAQALRLIEEAANRRLVLLVDHTFVYTAAVRRMRDLIAAGQLGEFHYYEATRVNLGRFQADVNVLWDLAIHDLAILDYIVDARPEAVSATGTAHVEGAPENLAHLTLFLPRRAMAQITVNWLAPVKLRQVRIGGSRRMFVYDEEHAGEKLRIYDQGVTLVPPANGLSAARIDYRREGVTAPALSAREALATEMEHFLDCIATGAVPLTGGAMALRLIHVLELASLSMRQRGKPIEVPRD